MLWNIAVPALTQKNGESTHTIVVVVLLNVSQFWCVSYSRIYEWN